MLSKEARLWVLVCVLLCGVGFFYLLDFQSKPDREPEPQDLETQFNLGVMYRDGLGVRQDLKQTYAWFSVARANGYPTTELPEMNMFLNGTRKLRTRDLVAQELSPQELTEGQALAAIIN